MNEMVGSRDLVWVVLDALRYDVAGREMAAGRTPNLAALFPGGWERRHSPATFTLPAHQAFFAGFLPTPAETGPDQRLLALRFGGSRSTGPRTCVLDGPDIVHGLANKGYHTICIGGVGFFNGRTPLGRVLPGYFEESHWSPAMGVGSPDSAARQFQLAGERLAAIPTTQRVFLFINVSAIHHPNRCYVPGKAKDDLESHAAALRYVDHCLPRLIEVLQGRADAHMLVFSDHGTLYGEDGFEGHRVAHPHVLTVPYAATLLNAR